jgi:hypothetical protein
MLLRNNVVAKETQALRSHPELSGLGKYPELHSSHFPALDISHSAQLSAQAVTIMI